MTLGRRSQDIRAVLVHGVVLAVALAAFGAAPWAVRAHAGTGRLGAVDPCTTVDRGFRPTELIVDGVRRTKVLPRGQDRNGVPLPPPLTARGKWQVAWDKAVGVRPGDRRGVVRLTAHTYPTAKPAPALGNLLLERLRPGARLKVRGAGGQQLCYRVTRRQQVRATALVADYYDTTGPARLAILVCSGRRRGPGDWTHRTIWYAEPLAQR